MTPTALVQPESQAAARLHGRVVARQTLDTRIRDAMFSLLAAHFVGVDRTTFDRDLEDKSCAILLEDEAGDVRGFSTMVVYESCAAGTPTASKQASPWQPANSFPMLSCVRSRGATWLP